MIRLHHIACLVAVVTACGPGVPEQPSYEDDVKPILLANCARCHGVAPAGASDPRFCLRVDVWDAIADTTGACPVDQADPSGVAADIVYGAQLGAEQIVAQSLSGAMPKDGPGLTARQLEILTAWRDAGFPRRGPGSNTPPAIEFIAPPASGVTVDVTALSYDVEYVVSDPDGDAVTWSLTWAGAGRSGTFATGLREGSGSVTVDISVLGEGSYTLTAHLDDAIEPVDVDAPGALIVPPGRNATPLVTVVAPNGGESFYMDQTATVTFVADDAEDGTVTCDVDAVHGATSDPIASGVSATSAQPAMVSWSLAAAAIAADYRIEVRCTDAGTPAQTGTDRSDGTFAVTAPPQQVSFATQVLPLFTAGPSACTGGACHDATLPQEGLNLTAGAAYAELVGVPSGQCGTMDLVEPGQPDQSYLVIKLQGFGACLTGSKMPKPPQTPLSAAQIQLVRDWIANGAPDN